jgi:hypothetical protein
MDVISAITAGTENNTRFPPTTSIRATHVIPLECSTGQLPEMTTGRICNDYTNVPTKPHKALRNLAGTGTARKPFRGSQRLTRRVGGMD